MPRPASMFSLSHETLSKGNLKKKILLKMFLPPLFVCVFVCRRMDLDRVGREIPPYSRKQNGLWGGIHRPPQLSPSLSTNG